MHTLHMRPLFVYRNCALQTRFINVGILNLQYHAYFTHETTYVYRNRALQTHFINFNILNLQHHAQFTQVSHTSREIGGEETIHINNSTCELIII